MLSTNGLPGCFINGMSTALCRGTFSWVPEADENRGPPMPKCADETVESRHVVGMLDQNDAAGSLGKIYLDVVLRDRHTAARLDSAVRNGC